MSENRSSKNWVAALVLCIFLGGLGIHRFYVARPAPACSCC